MDYCNFPNQFNIISCKTRIAYVSAIILNGDNFFLTSLYAFLDNEILQERDLLFLEENISDLKSDPYLEGKKRGIFLLL